MVKRKIGETLQYSDDNLCYCNLLNFVILEELFQFLRLIVANVISVIRFRRIFSDDVTVCHLYIINRHDLQA